MTPSDGILERAFLDDASIAAGWTRAGALAERGAAIEAAHPDSGSALVAMVAALGDGGLLRLLAAERDGGAFAEIGWRAVCLARERLAYTSPLLELAFTMQGLGSMAIALGGSDEQRRTWLPDVIAGRAVAAFALTEPEAGSDLGELALEARLEGDHYVLSGHKTFITNAPVATLFTVFAVTAPPGHPRRVTAFIVPRDTDGLRTLPQRVLGDHPIGEVVFDAVRVPVAQRIGGEGDGMRLALGTLHRFRPTVGAAALGFGQRALDEAVHHVRGRRQFGAPLADLQAVRLALADCACDLEGARLLVYRAAARADAGAGRHAEAHAGSMAKLVATEAAFRVIDRAVQLHGGRGVLADSVVGRLYQEVRALRIYEGASDIQRVLIARGLLEPR
ncbi:MAG: acyl-CoA dehydrogenase family protein [Sandaracinaceae bacterium]